MRLVFFGTPDFAVPCLQRLLDRPEFEVVAVVTQPDRRRGRGSELIPSPVKQLALAAGLPVWQPDRVKKDPETLDRLRATAADCFVVVAYGQLLSAEMLAMPRLGCVNAHGSLLPAYRGAAPIQRCLQAGDDHTGIVTMLMDEGMDTGPMLLRAETPIALTDNAHTLADRLATLAADLLPPTLLGLANGLIDPQPQPTGATHAPPIQKPEWAIDWSAPAIAIHNQVRGLWPNCHSSLRNSPLKVLETLPLEPAYIERLPAYPPELRDRWDALTVDWAAVAGGPGAIVTTLKGWGPVVRTGEGYLLLHQVIPAGKRSQSGWDFANGLRLQPGECLALPT
ncbi:MAG: methionyl-tRNA formyltransferase [Oscillatoriales cyanobacterium]|nr:MAG: methionyl-tRNA formyltransferase [Oscillatoriales cyanobacterium]